jgi:6-phosphogluconate dehydrogenase
MATPQPQSFDVGMVGLGVMGRNLLLNLAERRWSGVGYDKNTKKSLLLLEMGRYPMKLAVGGNPRAFVGLLKPPRTIFLMVAPPPVVDAVLDDLTPFLTADDLVIDAGNSYFKDTDRRSKALAETGIHFLGMGVSGGEAGARSGPSLMPGGPREAYERVRPMLESVAAKVGDEPCVAWMGRGAAGHYVKMVHNGVEYGVMQLLAEAYDLMKRGLGLNNDELAEVFEQWNKGELGSFLIEISAAVFRQGDDQPTGDRLIDRIKGAAREKGTGKWASQEALDLHVPLPTIDIAVSMRHLSAREALRNEAQQLFPVAAHRLSVERAAILADLEKALYVASVTTYAQGFDLLRQAAAEYQYELNLEEIARIWRGGCIIRAALLEDVRAAFKARADLPHLLLDARLAAKVCDRQANLRAIVRTAAELGLPAPGLTASLGYFDALRSGWLPANLIQAQRDFFGAHTYERTDQAGDFHAKWGA